MWSYEHEVTTPATPAAVYARYADVASWPEWDASVAAVTLDGPFAAGASGTLAIVDIPETIPFRITAAEPDRGFDDESHAFGHVLRFSHRLEVVSGGTRIRHRVEVEGPAAAEVGAGVVADMPEAMKALARAAGA